MFQTCNPFGKKLLDFGGYLACNFGFFGQYLHSVSVIYGKSIIYLKRSLHFVLDSLNVRKCANSIVLIILYPENLLDEYLTLAERAK
jgi:hypothetical protein